jgi:HEAT repeat protein
MSGQIIVGLVLLTGGQFGEAAEEKNAQLIQELVSILKDKSGARSVFTRIQAAQTIGRLGPAARSSVPALVSFLDDATRKDPTVLDEEVIKALGKIGRSSRPAIPALVRAGGKGFDLELAVNRTIDEILFSPLDGPEDVPTLIRNLRDRDASVRLRATKVLQSLGTVAKGASPQLTDALRDNDPDVRRQALLALRAVDPSRAPGEPEVSLYVLELKSPDDFARMRAAKALGRLGAVAAPALPALLVATADSDPDVRRLAMDAINRIQPR